MKKHFHGAVLVVIILLTVLFILGETLLHTAVTQTISILPTLTHVAAVADFDSNLVGRYLSGGVGTVNISDNSSLTGMSALTVSLWVNVDEHVSSAVVSKRHSTAPYYSYNVSLDTQSSNRALCSVVNDTQKSASGGGNSNTLSLGSWHHVVCVYDGTKVSVYTDGVKNGFSANLSGTVFDSDGPLLAPYVSTFPGHISNIRIYSKALSDTEITELYAEGSLNTSGQTGTNTDTPPDTSTQTPPPPPPTTTTPPTTPAPTPTPTGGRLVNAASCSQTDVQRAIDTATDGDTVSIPAGTCTWPVPVMFCKSIILRGAGVGMTNIVDNTTTVWNQAPIWIDSSCNGKTFRITGFSFSDSGANDFVGVISIKGNDVRYRLDHLAFTNLSERAFWLEGNRSYGVVDHVNTVYTKHGQSVFVAEADYNGAWSRPMTYGTEQAVFIEDSFFDYSAVTTESAVTDCERGGRYTFRHNTIVGDSGITNHGLDSVMRSCLQMEIYNNSLTSDLPGSYRAIYSRGGSAIIFNNTITGRFYSPLGMTSYRSCGYAGAVVRAGTGPTAPNFGTCDGTNPLDGNTSPQSTYKGWPCKDQIGRGSNQTSEPVYEWNNTMNGANTNIQVNNTWLPQCTNPQPSDHIKEGRDYFTNTPRPGYTPYTYPHPMTTSGFTGDDPTRPLPSPATPAPTVPQNPTTPVTPLTGDFNHDGLVNSVDFSLLISAWNQPSTTYDLNGDGLVNTLDYAIMAQHWSR